MIINRNLVTEPEVFPISEREVLRYAKCKDSDPLFLALFKKCKEELIPELKNTALYRILPYSSFGEECRIGEIKVKSKSLSKFLSGSEYVILFVATLGIGADRLISKYERISLSSAHMLNSLANERIESLCDSFCRKIQTELDIDGYTLTSRFSSGYGDLPIELQRDIFKILNPEKHIGVTLSDSIMMIPTKSVSALIGVKRTTKDDIS